MTQQHRSRQHVVLKASATRLRTTCLLDEISPFNTVAALALQPTKSFFYWFWLPFDVGLSTWQLPDQEDLAHHLLASF